MDYDVGRLVGLEDFVVVTQTHNGYLRCGFGVGVLHGHGRTQEHTFLCFLKAKTHQEKNCNELHAVFKKVSLELHIHKIPNFGASYIIATSISLNYLGLHACMVHSLCHPHLMFDYYKCLHVYELL